MMTRLPGYLLLGILMVAFVAILVWSICMIPIKQEATRVAWAELRSHYQTRADLAPSLAASAPMPADVEERARTGVMQAHSAVLALNVDAATLDDPSAFAAYLAAQHDLSNTLNELLAITASCPQSKSDQSFLGLKRKLQDVDSHILLAEQNFDQAARAYNTELQNFPGFFWMTMIFRSARPVPRIDAEQALLAALHAAVPETAIVSG